MTLGVITEEGVGGEGIQEYNRDFREERGRNLGLNRYGVLKDDANSTGLKLARVHG